MNHDLAGGASHAGMPALNQALIKLDGNVFEQKHSTVDFPRKGPGSDIRLNMGSCSLLKQTRHAPFVASYS